MTKVDIDKALFSHLKEHYENAKKDEKFHTQFLVGFDYMESLVKLFGSLMISALKHKDENLYDKLIKSDFQLHPSLGNFVNLVKNPLSKDNHKLLKGEPLYDFLYETLKKDKKSGKIGNIISVLKGEQKIATQNVSSTWNLLENHIVIFRNKTKGHGGAFSEDDTVLRENILQIMDIIISTLEIDYDRLVNNAVFEIDESRASNEYPLLVTYKESIYSIVPILAFVGCDHSRCNGLKKLFFYNGGKETKPEYLNHSFSHSSFVPHSSNFHSSVSKFQAEINKSKKVELLKDFVGRERELELISEHIQNNKSSLIKVYGKPGIGKSALLTQLEDRLREQNSQEVVLNTHIFYALKKRMDVEEDKYFFSAINAKFNDLGVEVQYEENETIKSKFAKLFSAYEKSATTLKLVLMIDGLDEFESPLSIIDLLPLNYSNKIHIILSFRDILKIMSTLNVRVEDNGVSGVLTQELGKLNDAEVETLLAQALPREVDVESKEYENIVTSVAKNSEGLPLYIHFITQKLKEIKKSENVTQEILAWALKLPPKLESFYQEVFQSVEPLAREILYLAYLSKTGIDLDMVYEILFLENDAVDEVLFREKFFNEIEVFLKYDANGEYVFYHLSVKEAILKYQKNQNSILTYNLENLENALYPSLIQRHQNRLNEIEYIKENSTIYKTLNKSVNYLKENREREFAKENLIHLSNTLVWVHIYHEQITYDDMKREIYASLSSELSEKNRDEIDKFFELVDSKGSEKYRFELRCAFELAFLSQEYTKVLEYRDKYENSIEDMFLEVAFNIDKPEFIQKFVEHKNDWLDTLSVQSKNILISILHHQERLDEGFVEVLDFFTNEEKSRLASNFSIEVTLNIIKKISDDKYKLVVIEQVIDRVNTHELFVDLIKMIQELTSTDLKHKAMRYLSSHISNEALLNTTLENLDAIYSHHLDADKKLAFIITLTREIDEDELLLQILNAYSKQNFFDDILKGMYEYKGVDCLTSVIENDNKLKLKIIKFLASVNEFSSILEYVQSMTKKEQFEIADKVLEYTKEEDAFSTYRFIESFISDSKLLAVALFKLPIVSKEMIRISLQAISNMPDSMQKRDLLSQIHLDKLEGRDCKNIIDIVKDENEEVKKSLLIQIVSKCEIGELNEILIMASSIKNPRYKNTIIAVVALKMGYYPLYEESMKILRNLKDFDVFIVGDIVSNIDSMEHILKIVDDYAYESKKADTLRSTAVKIKSKEDLDAVLRYIDTFDQDSRDVENTLVEVASNLYDLDEALKICDNLNDSYDKRRVLANIIEKNDDIEIVARILSKAITISEDGDRTAVITASLDKDQGLHENMIEVANSLFTQQNRLYAYRNIIDDVKDVYDALDIAKKIKNDKERSRMIQRLANRAKNVDELVTLVNNMSYFEYKYYAIENNLDNFNDERSISLGLDLVDRFNNKSEYKSKTLTLLAPKISNEPLLNKAFKISLDIFDDEQESESIVALALNKNSVSIISEMIDRIETIAFNKRKSKILFAIVKNENSVEESLKVINGMHDNFYKANALNELMNQEVSQESLPEIMTIIENSRSFSGTVKALKKIILLNTDNDIVKRIIQLARKFNTKTKIEVFSLIVSKIDDKIILDEVLDNVSIKEDVVLSGGLITQIAVRKSDDELLYKTFEYIEEIPNDVGNASIKDSVLVAMASNVDDTQKLNLILEKMRFDISQSNIYAAQLTRFDNSCFNATELLNMFHKLKFYQQSTSILSLLKRDDTFDEAFLEFQREPRLFSFDCVKVITERMNDSQVRQKLSSQVLDLIYAIEKSTDRFKSLNEFLKVVDDKKYVEDIFKYVKNISGTRGKYLIFESALKYKDEELLSQSIESLDKFSNSQKMKEFSALKKLSNLLFAELFNSETTMLETVEMVTALSSSDVLSYYDVASTSQLQIVLKISTREEFRLAKEKILKDELLLNEFITLYGEALDIDDLDSFEDEFSYKKFNGMVR